MKRPGLDGGIEPWSHGDICDAELRELGLDPGAIVDFSVNIDPRGPHKDVKKGFLDANIARYPDPEARDLRLALAHRDGVPPEHIAIGCGVSGLIWSLMLSVSKRSTVLIPQHTFSEYRAASEAAELSVEILSRDFRTGFSLDWDQIEQWISARRNPIFFVGSPDNPTGVGVDYEVIEAIARRHRGARIVLDEAFLPLSVDHLKMTRGLPTNVIRLRSLTKELGMPGLRVGYGIMSVEDRRRLENRTAPWTVGAAAQAAATAGVRNLDLVPEVRERMRSDVVALESDLATRGWQVYGSQTVYMLMAVESASGLARRLRAKGVLIRDCSSFGLGKFVRLCGLPRSSRLRLLAALRDERPPANP